uniref:Nuclear receptor domain-containing protein n=1 Tax=Capra hircus TaxID=9925 RepID=A0A8C2N908_CAPHI
MCQQPAPWACWENLPPKSLPWVQSLCPIQVIAENNGGYTQQKFLVFQGPATATPIPEAMASGEDEPRNCAVCGDQATGYHFHALTCEGCKGFFRRTVNKSTSLMCPFAGSCEVNKAQRRHCPACRWQKCLDAGMKKDTTSSSVHPLPALAHPGPCTAPAHAFRRCQHFHGTASHQVHQGSAPLSVLAHGGPDLPSQGSSYRDLSYCTQHHFLSPNTKLPLWASSLHHRRCSPSGVPGRVFGVPLWLP